MVYQYCLFFVVKTFQIYSLNNFEVYRAVLFMVTMLYIRSPELTCLINGSLYSLTNISPFSPPPAPGDHHSIMFLWVWLFQKTHIIYLVFVFLCLTFSFNNALKIYTILSQMADFALYTYMCVCVCVCMLVAQLYLALCDPMGCCLPGSTVHGILQARSWSGQTFPSPGDLPDLGIEPGSPQVSCIAADSVPSELPGDSIPLYVCTISSLSIPLLSYC